MAASLKTKGIEELSSLRRRVHRQYGLGRISRPDRETLIGLLDQFEAHVIRMPEKTEYEEEYL